MPVASVRSSDGSVAKVDDVDRDRQEADAEALHDADADMVDSEMSGVQVVIL